MRDLRWYTTAQIAELLGRSDRFVRDRIRSGEINASEHKGDKRSSYKISAEALASYLIASQRKEVAEVAELLDEVGSDYLQNLQLALEEEFLSRRQMRVEIIPKCLAGIRPLMELEARRYEELFVPENVDIYQRFYANLTHFTSGALDRDANRLEGHLSVGVTTVDFFEAICKSQVSDEQQVAWEKGKTPVLYINSFILDDPIWAIYLFRHMAEQLNEFMRLNSVRVTKAFAVGAIDDSTQMLRRYGFEQVDSYQGKYPVMLNANIGKGRMGRFFDL